MPVNPNGPKTPPQLPTAPAEAAAPLKSALRQRTEPNKAPRQVSFTKKNTRRLYNKDGALDAHSLNHAVSAQPAAPGRGGSTVHQTCINKVDAEGVTRSYWHNGQVYHGERDTQGRPHGTGILQLKDGTSVHSQWQAGRCVQVEGLGRVPVGVLSYRAPPKPKIRQPRSEHGDGAAHADPADNAASSVGEQAPSASLAQEAGSGGKMKRFLASVGKKLQR